jgi:UDPglucose 6-dehydrogenase
MKIGVIGQGVVGSAVSAGMERLGHELRIHDIKLKTDISIVNDTEIVFICVPTPQKHDGSCDTNIVESVIRDLIGLKYAGIIAIKSTVNPGFTEQMMKQWEAEIMDMGQTSTSKFCFVPEFLREKSAFYDFTEGHDILVVGVHNSVLCDKVVRAHGHYPKSIAQMKPTEAELAKYYSNTFNALRIVFANGFYEVCKKLGADYSKIKHAMMKRPTMVDVYMDCNENFRGFAGVCLPKDTSAFASLSTKLGVKAQIFQTIVDDNRLYRPTVFDGMRMN